MQDPGAPDQREGHRAGRLRHAREELQGQRELLNLAACVAGRGLAVGGVALRCDTPSEVAPWAIDPLRAAFAVPAAPRIVPLSLHYGRLPRLGWSRLRYRPNWLWTAEALNGGFLVAVKGPSRAATPARLAVMTTDWSAGDLCIRVDAAHSGLGRDPLEFPLDVVLFAGALAHTGAAVVHGSALVRDGRAVVFAGPSGAGKTTIARLFRQAGYTLLNDERVVLRAEGQEVRAYGTPWHGEIAEARAVSAPVDTMCLIEHGTRTEVSSLAAHDAARHLMARSRLPFWDPLGMERLLDGVIAVVARVRCVRLAFRPDASALTAVEELSGR